MTTDTFDTLDQEFTEYLLKTTRTILSVKFSNSFILAAETMAGCRGTVITTGMGKAGHVAQKVSSSLSSLGVPSAYIHPGEAAHGDIGVVKNGDVLLAFSTSGKTREVLETVHFAKALGASSVISVTSHPDAPIREMSDIVLDMGVISEAGDLGLAPTTSIIVMLVISDFIALLASRIKGFSKSDFALRHHGGYLGEKSRGEKT